MASIRVTPEDLESQGNELIGFAGDLADVLNSIDSKINEIIDGWDGLSQDACEGSKGAFVPLSKDDIVEIYRAAF